jgi:hypothetical protein
VRHLRRRAAVARFYLDIGLDGFGGLKPETGDLSLSSLGPSEFGFNPRFKEARGFSWVGCGLVPSFLKPMKRVTI